MNSINKYTEYQETFKDKKKEIKKNKIKNRYENINFETVSKLRYYTVKIFTLGFGGHSYQEDIKYTCGNFTEMLNLIYNSTINSSLEQLEDLKNKGNDLINLIFLTATSGFESTRKNIDKFNKIKQNYLKFLNSLRIHNYLY